jgi:hypothetical protein
VDGAQYFARVFPLFQEFYHLLKPQFERIDKLQTEAAPAVLTAS